MRLINIETMNFSEFFGETIPSYAILSREWGDSKVNYPEFQDLDIASRKTAYAKIVRACQLAKVDDLQYIWIDTSCIDKSNSSKRTEAIISIYHAYLTFSVQLQCQVILPV